MRVIILILTYDDGGGYSIMDNCVKSTWGGLKYDNVDFFYYYSKPLNNQDCLIDGNNIIFDGTESYHTIGLKTIKSFKYIVKKNFDFLLRTNSSSFIDINNLLNYLNDKPKNKFYSHWHLNTLNLEVNPLSLINYCMNNQFQ